MPLISEPAHVSPPPSGLVLAARVGLLPALHRPALLADQRELPRAGRPGRWREGARLPEGGAGASL